MFQYNKTRTSWGELRNPVSFFLLIIAVYYGLEVFNPNAVSLAGWLASLRDNLSVLLYVIAFFVIQSIDDIRLFTKFWLALAGLAAFYGVYQEVFGLTDFEWNWIWADPNRFDLYFIAGHMRKFSFMSDPATFGIFMAYTALACVALMFGPIRTWAKLLCGLIFILSCLSMVYSGTRTAYAVFGVGMFFYVFLTIRNWRSIILAGVGAVIGLAVLFAPIYTSPELNRIRSTFRFSEDPSMEIRNQNRIKYQTYIRSHPIGGGINTVGNPGTRYSPGHPLAGVPPDSGYLLVALEQGWIGLILFMAFVAYVSCKGVSAFFASEDKWKKMMAAAYVVPFFALSIGHFTQDVMFQKPFLLIVITTYAIVERLPKMKAQSDQ